MPFDFHRHRQASREAYVVQRPLYEQLAEAVRAVLRASIPGACPIHSIEARAKGIDQFADKACKQEASGDPKYPTPLSQITDKAGVRVITFFPRNVVDVCQVVEAEFDVVEKADKSQELVVDGRFGYLSIHYLVKLKQTRTGLPEYQRFAELLAEIQIRTILQHAWAEMEHDIQYKSPAAIPTLIRRRFMSLAGMLEIADREFQAIQDADSELRKEVRLPLEEELTAVPELKVELLPPERQLQEIDTTAPPASREYIRGSARALLASGYYAEAVKAYDAAIANHPGGHTNYIGRARARFLLGDQAGALGDLQTAANLTPDDPNVLRLRSQIEEGAVPTPEERAAAQAQAYAGNSCVAAGRGQEALEHYRNAEASGWNPLWSTFNKAIASCLSGDLAAMSNYLSTIRVQEGSVYGITKHALQTIGSSVEGRDVTDDLAKLKRDVEAMQTYSYARSHLRFLEEGLWKISPERARQAAPVFNVLRGPEPPVS